MTARLRSHLCGNFSSGQPFGCPDALLHNGEVSVTAEPVAIYGGQSGHPFTLMMTIGNGREGWPYRSRHAASSTSPASPANPLAFHVYVRTALACLLIRGAKAEYQEAACSADQTADGWVAWNYTANGNVRVGCRRLATGGTTITHVKTFNLDANGDPLPDQTCP